MSKKPKEIVTYSPMEPSCTDSQTLTMTSETWPSTGLHCHDFYEFYLFINGHAYYYLDEQLIELKPYTLIIMPPFHLHGFLANQLVKDYERAWLYVSPHILRTISLDIQDFASLFLEFLQTGKSYFYIDQKTAEALRASIHKIAHYVTDQSTIGRWKKHIYIADFIAKVYDIAQSTEIVAKPIILDNTIQTIIAYINKHYTEKISVSELSRHFGISSSHLSRNFSSYTGRSIYDYVQYRRIIHAKELIYIGKSFTEIAFECGFNDYSCFLRAFQKETNQTPSAYKKYINNSCL